MLFIYKLNALFCFSYYTSIHLACCLSSFLLLFFQGTHSRQGRGFPLSTYLSHSVRPGDSDGLHARACHHPHPHRPRMQPSGIRGRRQSTQCGRIQSTTFVHKVYITITLDTTPSSLIQQRVTKYITNTIGNIYEFHAQRIIPILFLSVTFLITHCPSSPSGCDFPLTEDWVPTSRG